MEDEIDFYKISNVINQVDELMNNQVGSINTLVSNKELQGICKKYEKNKSELSDIGFNVFTIVSDKSYSIINACQSIWKMIIYIYKY